MMVNILLMVSLSLLHPESAFELNGKLYVSDIGKFGVEDGRILVKKSSSWTELAHGMLDPKGLAAVDDSTLIVTDVKRVRKVSLSGRVEDAFPYEAFPKDDRPQFLNDITVGPDGYAYFSDTKTNTVYKGDLRNGSVEKLFSVSSPNGLAFGEDSTLYVVTFEKPGKVYAFKGGRLKLVFSSHDIDGGDGLAVAKDGRLVISGFLSGKVVILDLKTGKHTVLKKGLDNPADLSLSRDGARIYVPLLSAGKVIELNLPKRRKSKSSGKDDVF